MTCCEPREEHGMRRKRGPDSEREGGGGGGGRFDAMKDEGGGRLTRREKGSLRSRRSVERW